MVRPASPGDYLYYSTRTFAFESGAWGIFRVHDRLQSNLKAAAGPDHAVQRIGLPEADRGHRRTPSRRRVRTRRRRTTPTARSTPRSSPRRPTRARPAPAPCNYDVSVFNKALPTAPFPDTSGVIYALTSDMAAIQAGTKPVEPLVLRANQGDCVQHHPAQPDHGGLAVRRHPGRVRPRQAARATSSCPPGRRSGSTPTRRSPSAGRITYKFYADAELGTTIFQNLGSVGSLRHGAYGMLIVEPQGSTLVRQPDQRATGRHQDQHPGHHPRPGRFTAVPRVRADHADHGPAVRAQHRAVHRHGGRQRDQQPHRCQHPRRAGIGGTTGHGEQRRVLGQGVQPHELPHPNR